jgi:hypothetical protein
MVFKRLVDLICCRTKKRSKKPTEFPIDSGVKDVLRERPDLKQLTVRQFIDSFQIVDNNSEQIPEIDDGEAFKSLPTDIILYILQFITLSIGRADIFTEDSFLRQNPVQYFFGFDKECFANRRPYSLLFENIRVKAVDGEELAKILAIIPAQVNHLVIRCSSNKNTAMKMYDFMISHPYLQRLCFTDQFGFAGKFCITSNLKELTLPKSNVEFANHFIDHVQLHTVRRFHFKQFTRENLRAWVRSCPQLCSISNVVERHRDVVHLNVRNGRLIDIHLTESVSGAFSALSKIKEHELRNLHYKVVGYMKGLDNFINELTKMQTLLEELHIYTNHLTFGELTPTLIKFIRERLKNLKILELHYFDFDFMELKNELINFTQLERLSLLHRHTADEENFTEQCNELFSSTPTLRNVRIDNHCYQKKRILLVNSDS